VDGQGGETVIDPADVQRLMDVEWEVHVPGRAPFALHEEGRRCPSWVVASSLPVGRGRRFWSLRLRRTHGLLADVPIPCLVDPTGTDRIWIDWDEAYSVHQTAWDRMSAVERAVAERRGGIDAVAGRLVAPLRPRLDPRDAHLVDEAVAAEAAVAARERAEAERTARISGGPAELEHYVARHERITATGRPAPATVVSAAPTGGTAYGLPEWAIELDVTDGTEVRRVVHHEPMGRTRAPWTPGTRTTVRIDPDDPDQLTFA